MEAASDQRRSVNGDGKGGAKALLRVITCGSVDDGKSTLIGRLLYDSKLLFDDQLAALERDSRKHGSAGDEIDFALLLDGLDAEREQGITIDVAYRFFTTPIRKIIVADAPGHVQYTRNMATGASNADLAVILVDARKGILTQTRRHSFIASLLGIRHVVLAVNKIDLVGHSQEVFDEIVADYRAFARELQFDTMQAIPISARFGAMVTSRTEALAWYVGPALLDYLEAVEVEPGLQQRPFRFPVQWVNRPDLDFRGFSGTIADGQIAVGDAVVACLSGRKSTIRKISTFDGDKTRAARGEAVTLVLDDEIDISRGDLLSGADGRPDVADQFAAHIIWMHEEALLPGRPLLLKCASKTVLASVTEIKHRIDADNFQKLAAKQLALNDIAVANISTHEPLAFDPYAVNRTTGSFILIDRMTNQTVGAGMIDFALRRATNINWQAVDINKRQRMRAKGHRPAVLWFTGLSGAGKSTIANLVEQRLFALGCHTYLLDGDNLRHGVNRNLGFTTADRVENIRRAAEIAKLFVDAGLIVLASFISPFRAERQLAREILEPGEFIEIFVDAPLAVAEQRDPKGLYKSARAGAIRNFTGIDSPYEPPQTPEIHLNADGQTETVDAMADRIVAYLRGGGFLK
ncbi:adenylyltransferase [Bosea sp. Leaf344]|uniref:sulfate adenylyltransferase subunit CysN n=1 Tax=Bosea sp. Leaf344 TaxID=1736346 RepID=UPI000701C17E|nr:sulfate adenylyltransferase subunit CysN [Bosea sp. Leaf344]KQU54808.1 adenylyltransferase [Bosea sp. Leaf344]